MHSPPLGASPRDARLKARPESRYTGAPMARKKAAAGKPRMHVFTEKHSNITTVELRESGRSISRLYMFNLHMHIGCARVRMAGIGGVGTLPELRNRGYSRMCLTQSIETMSDMGTHISTLFGIGNFYPKWGFASAIAEPRLSISTRSAEESVPTPGQRVVPFDPARHTPDLLRLYAANNSLRTCAVVRPGPIIRSHLKSWVPFQKGSSWEIPVEAFMVVDSGGNIRGYAAHDKRDSQVIVIEAGFDDPDVFPTITAELAKRAVARRTGEITFLFPPDHPLAKYLHRWDCTHRLTFNKNSNGMARIIRLYDTFKVCAPELSRRLASSMLAGKSFSLGLETDIGSITINSRRGAVSVARGLKSRHLVRIPQDRLTQLLLGYRPWDDVAGDEGVIAQTGASEFLPALFPPGFPYMWEADRF